MDFILPIVIGFVAGYLSGHFGIGGGFLMQPALRLIVNMPALISLGTPIPVIVVSAVTGGYNYYRGGFIDFRLALYLSITGIFGTIIGSLATAIIEGDLLLLLTAIALMLTSVRYILENQRNSSDNELADGSDNKSVTKALVIGFIAGFLGGLLGLGGGFLLVPALTIIFKKDIKTAIGTSLFVIIAYAIPGAATHYLLGHVNLLLALLLAVGIVPGAYLGSKVAIGLPEAILRRMFGILLFGVSLYFAVFEIRVLLGM